MRRERYSMVLPISVLILVAVGFALGILIPNLQASFYIIFILAGGAIVLTIDRMARHRVDEAVTDERIQNIAEQAAFLAYKITFAMVMIVAVILINALPNIEGARLVGVGASCAIGLQSLIYGVCYSSIRGRRQ